MKKVLIAFDGTQFCDGAFEFARTLNELQPILLTGLFIPQISYANLYNYSGAMAGPVYASLIEEEDIDAQQKNIERFESSCIKNGIAFRVHQSFDHFALSELKLETRFSDLLLISSEKFFKNLLGGDPSDYMMDAIHESECPVLVVPEKFSFPKRNVIAYDGGASSVYAIKQFAYIFPELAVNETLLVYSKDEESLKLPHEDHVTELASQHYKNLSLQKLEDDSKQQFGAWLKKESCPILICGAFGRSSLSRLFRKSFVTQVIADHKLPVFIAHS